jgi:hypothetical protein
MIYHTIGAVLEKENKMSEPTIKEIESMIEEVELKLKKQGMITDERLQSHLDNLNQLHISKVLELKDETIVIDDIGQIYNPENIKAEINTVCQECNDTKEVEDGSFLGLDEEFQPVYETWQVDCPNCFVDENIKGE